MANRDVTTIKRLCRKFYDDLQAVFDRMDADDYETSEAAIAAVQAQGYAEDAANSDN